MSRVVGYFCLATTAAALGLSCSLDLPADAPLIGRQPRIAPDYTDTTLPPNIASPNFAVDEKGDSFAVRISGESGRDIVVGARDGKVRIPEKAWRALLSRNRGKSLSIVVYVLMQGRWHQFQAVRSGIAKEEIDSYVVYRWMLNLHHAIQRLYLIQRSLGSFHDDIVLDNRSIGGGCMNCHAFLNGHTETMTYQIRSRQCGLPMVLVKGDRVTPVDTRTAGFSESPASFTSWHPSGKLIAFSVNRVRPFEHNVGHARGEWDEDSDLAIYHVDENRVSSVLGIADPGRRETFPAWSADGRRLLFSSAPQLPFSEFRKVRYDLMQIAFNPATGEWGRPEVLVSSAEANMSCVEPRVSPDGKWVVFAGAEYGQMACYLDSSDLYLLSTDTGEHRKLEISSDMCDSWPTWSSNGRWISFASKRRDGLLSHIYFSYFDKHGKAHKPFILPQEDPGYYDSCAMTYNRPELAIEPVRITGAALAEAICRSKETLEPPKAFDRSDRRVPSQAPGRDEWEAAGRRTQGAH